MIAFEIPKRFLEQVVSGDLLRYGGLLKDSTSGLIVGHLKETGNIGMNLASMVPSGLLLPASGIQMLQLGKIQHTLDSLKLISSIGAVASVANLGVSVAGFAIVIKKLNRIESKLDHQTGLLEEIAKRQRMQILKSEAFMGGRVCAALEDLQSVELTRDSSRREKVLLDARSKLRELRLGYHQFLAGGGLWADPTLPLNSVRDLYSRYVALGLAQAHAEFRLGELDNARDTLDKFLDEARLTGGFDKVQIFRTRSDLKGGDTAIVDRGQAQQRLADEIKAVGEIVDETLKRIESLAYEYEYVDGLGISTDEYLEELSVLKTMEPNIVLMRV